MNVALSIDPMSIDGIDNRDSEQAVLVAGLGLTGWSVVRYLAAKGKPVVVTDTRDTPPYLDDMRREYPQIRFVSKLPVAEYENFQAVIASPGLAPVLPNLIGDIELFAKAVKGPVIAITGSNGKSTVTMLVGEMLNQSGHKAAVGGNIGTPALDLLQHPEAEFYVLELSSFQLDTTRSLKSCASVVLNISEDHMDRYSDLVGYADSKLHIHDGSNCCIVNRDDRWLSQQMADREYGESRVSFGLDRPEPGQFGIALKNGERWFARGEELLAPVSSMTLRGEQNVSNALAALALVAAAGIELDQPCLQAMLDYPGLAHRCELIPSNDGISWINDSKGTNVGATLAAISGAEKPLILIAGGQGKGADFSPLATAMDSGIRAVILIGEDAAEISAALASALSISQAGLNTPIQCDSLSDAVNRARALAEPGDTVLFSPACASFDMFDNYQHRGDCFRELVEAGDHG